VYGSKLAKYVLLFPEQFWYRIKKAESMPIPKLQKGSPEKTYLPKNIALSTKQSSNVDNFFNKLKIRTKFYDETRLI
jgi:hypothetical protein